MSISRFYDARDFSDSFGLAMTNVNTPLEVTQDGFNFELLAGYPNPDVIQGDDAGCLVILDDKNLLLAGGYFGISRAFIFNRDDNQWREVGSMSEGRTYHSCGLIPSGDGSGYEVLAVGGIGAENLYPSSEIFNLETETWRTGIQHMALLTII